MGTNERNLSYKYNFTQKQVSFRRAVLRKITVKDLKTTLLVVFSSVLRKKEAIVSQVVYMSTKNLNPVLTMSSLPSRKIRMSSYFSDIKTTYFRVKCCSVSSGALY